MDGSAQQRSMVRYASDRQKTLGWVSLSHIGHAWTVKAVLCPLLRTCCITSDTRTFDSYLFYGDYLCNEDHYSVATCDSPTEPTCVCSLRSPQSVVCHHYCFFFTVCRHHCFFSTPRAPPIVMLIDSEGHFEKQSRAREIYNCIENLCPRLETFTPARIEQLPDGLSREGGHSVSPLPCPIRAFKSHGKSFRFLSELKACLCPCCRDLWVGSGDDDIGTIT